MAVSVSDLVATSIVLVILLNLLELAEKRDLAGWAGALTNFMRRLLAPGLPLVPWPPGWKEGAA